MDNISEKVALDEMNETPILKINLKCSCDDYQKVMQIVPQKYYDKIKLLKWYIIISVLYCVGTFPDLIKSISHHDYLFTSLSTTAYLFTIIIIYMYICFKKQRQPFTKALSKILIKHLSILYKDRTKDEIKKIIIPCELDFYETYIIKKTPSLKDVKKVDADKIIDLQLSFESPKIGYAKLKNIKVNDNYISFCTNCFIPKKQLNEIEKEQIDEILNELLQR